VDRQGKRESHVPGSGLPEGGGTEAPSRSNLEVSKFYPPLHGAEESRHSLSKPDDGTAPPGHSSAPLSEELALRPCSRDIKTGGCQAGDGWERGDEARGGLKSGTPSTSSSLLISELANHRRAMRHAKEAIEAVILKLHIEDRSDLAYALCELSHVLNGGLLR
jgi:hypothetical protein